MRDKNTDHVYEDKNSVSIYLVWKLKKCIHGLSDAPLKQYHQIKTFVLANNGKVSEIDPSLFTWHENNSRIGVIIVHIGDFFFAGNDSDDR